MSRTLFEISDDLAALELLLIESGGEIDAVSEPLIDNWFADLKHERNRKLDNYVGLIRELEARAMTRRAESQRLAERANVDENAAKRLKERLKFAFEFNGWGVIETDHFHLKLATAGGKQRMILRVPPEQLPEEFQKVTRVVEADKDQLRRILERDGVCEYAELEPRSTYLKVI